MPGMDDLVWPSLCVDGTLVVWSEAADSYLHNPALVSPSDERGWTVCEECGCPELAGPCAGGAFSTPAADGMPWVVAGRPETDEFLGVRVLPGTEMALRGSVTQDGDDAWTSGTVGCGKATLTGTFQVAGTTARGVRYGYQWFQRMVRWPCDCDCEASTLTLWLWCDPEGENGGRRHLRQARVVEWEIDDSNPLLGGCHGMNVNVTWEVEDARLWLDAVTIADTSAAAWVIDLADTAHSDGCVPMSMCPDGPDGMVYVEIEEPRPTRPIRVKSDGSWCPIGSYWVGELQAFGGPAVAVVEETVAVDTPSQTCAACADYGIRIYYDEPNGGAQAFQTVRWENGVWGQQTVAFPCACRLRVIETVHIYETPPTTEGQPNVLHVDKAAYSGGDPGDDDECCVIALVWTGPSGGTWLPVPAPGWQRREFHPSDDYVPVQSDFRVSGFPPVGCKIVVQRNECLPNPAAGWNINNYGNCDAGPLGITLRGDGRWLTTGWAFDPTAEFPLPGSELVVANQVDTPRLVGSWYPKDAFGCLPGGPATARATPLTDPPVDLSYLFDWCNPAALAVWATPIAASACERQQTTVVTVNAGGGELKWLRWVIWPRVAEYGDMDTPASRAQYKTVEPVAVGEVPLLAAGQAVRFDGQAGAITLTCDGKEFESELAGFGPSGLHVHPVLSPGDGYLFAVLPHPWATPDTAWYRAEVVEWELP